MAQLLTTCGVAITAGLVIIALLTLVERLSPRAPMPLRRAFPGLLFTLGATPIAILVAVPLGQALASFGPGKLVRVPLLAWLGPVGATLALLLFVDFLRYWEHRFEHRFLWRVHAVHHSAEHLSAANNFAHPLQYLPLFLFVSLPLSLFDLGGFVLPAGVAILKSVLEFFIHSPTTLSFGRARALLVDPPYHRIHHSIEQQHWDRNFGILFSFWDRLFGTAHMPASGEWPATGIPESRSPATVGEWLAFPFSHPPAPGEDARATLPEANTPANRHSALGV
ncbi:sterol desaturase family protein [Sphingomonas glaciei]|uniref:Sterol desaturase family protein n=1 Tax=Sphingomonas glaciei TaxID=2938948 RepID=A0ABY5MTQ6_9SPHN|nr:sterol desaturase family protein [Sphingomonas glaciei]UUR07885.1 sterol desaturase family protein [Sphingomonas glaciei]